jgi:hypothetical protein
MTDNIRNEFKGEAFNFMNNFYCPKMLEIGTVDGNFTPLFIKMLVNDQAFLHCVNPQGGIYISFIYKLKFYNEKFKVRFFKITTQNFFKLYRYSFCRKYNLIYVNVNAYDNIELSSLFCDLQNAYFLLQGNGILWINQLNNKDVQKYLKESLGKFEIFHIGEELGLKKVC